jgi:hypothetical protein
MYGQRYQSGHLNLFEIKYYREGGITWKIPNLCWAGAVVISSILSYRRETVNRYCAERFKTAAVKDNAPNAPTEDLTAEGPLAMHKWRMVLSKGIGNRPFILFYIHR